MQTSPTIQFQIAGLSGRFVLVSSIRKCFVQVIQIVGDDVWTWAGFIAGSGEESVAVAVQPSGVYLFDFMDHHLFGDGIFTELRFIEDVATLVMGDDVEFTISMLFGKIIVIFTDGIKGK